MGTVVHIAGPSRELLHLLCGYFAQQDDAEYGTLRRFDSIEFEEIRLMCPPSETTLAAAADVLRAAGYQIFTIGDMLRVLRWREEQFRFFIEHSERPFITAEGVRLKLNALTGMLPDESRKPIS